MKYQPRFSRTVGNGAKQISVQKLKVSGNVMKCENMIRVVIVIIGGKMLVPKAGKKKTVVENCCNILYSYFILNISGLIPIFFYTTKKGFQSNIEDWAECLEKLNQNSPENTPYKSQTQVERENNSGIISHQHKDFS